MRTVVVLSGLDEKGSEATLGTVSLIDGKVSVDVANPLLGKTILRTAIRNPKGGKLTATSDPAGWMDSLHKHFKSAYLMASKAVRRP